MVALWSVGRGYMWFFPKNSTGLGFLIRAGSKFDHTLFKFSVYIV